MPTKKIGDTYIMEIFHGPTFAFKDVALQALGNLFEYFLKRSGQRITVVGATSGDTGSAAIYGLRNKKGVECFILFPEGRVSPIQQLQMTSVLDNNVHCVAVQGTFDDCQDIVKALFRDLKFKKTYSLGAVNSINFARIMFQITYYFYTYFKFFPNCDGEMSFSVPTGWSPSRSTHTIEQRVRENCRRSRIRNRTLSLSANQPLFVGFICGKRPA